MRRWFTTHNLLGVATGSATASTQAAVNLPDWALWTIGGFILALVVTVVVRYLLQTAHRRIVWGAMSMIGLGGCVPKIATWFNVPGFGDGGFLLESAPAAAWPLAAIAIVALIVDCYLLRPTALPFTGAPSSGNGKANAFLGGRAASSTGSGHSVVGDGSPIVSNQNDASVHQYYGSDASTAKLLVEQAQENGRLKLLLEQSNAEKKKIEEQLANALARVESIGKIHQAPTLSEAIADVAIRSTGRPYEGLWKGPSGHDLARLLAGLWAWLRGRFMRAGTGDPAARAAVEEARQGRDPAKLQAVLLAERDRQETHVRAHAADWIELNRQIAAVAFVRGDIDVAVEALQKVLALAKEDVDAINRLGQIYMFRGDLDAAERQCRRVLGLGASDADRAIALGNLGLTALIRGDLDAAERFQNDSLAIARLLGDQEMQATNLGNLGLIARRRGDLDAAERFHNDSLAIERKLGRLEGQASDLGNLGLVAQARGDLGVAETRYKEVLAIEDTLRRLDSRANALGNLGMIARTRGDLDAAERLLNESLDIDRKLGRLENQANALANLGIVANERGQLADARRLWTESRDLNARVGIPEKVKLLQSLLDGLPPA